MKNTIFTGAGVAIITPMNDDGSINYEGFAENIEYQINNGTDAIIVCGTTGEASTMTDEEHIECIRFTVEKTKGRVPVIAGTGSNDTKYAVELSKTAQEKGADGLLLVTPYYNKALKRDLLLTSELYQKPSTFRLFYIIYPEEQASVLKLILTKGLQNLKIL